MPTPAFRSDRGFTLIEVLAALVIVSLGMLAVITAVSQTASTNSYLRDKTVAHWVAMNQLTKVRLQSAQPKIDKSSDEVEMAGRRWRWTMNVTQTAVESIRRIDVSVRPEEADEKTSMAFVSGFYGAAIAPPGTAPVSWAGTPGAGGPNGGGNQTPGNQNPGNQNPTPNPQGPNNGGGEDDGGPTETPPGEEMEGQ